MTSVWIGKMPISRRHFSSRPLGSEPAPVAANRGGYRRDSVNHVRCGVCTRELAEEGLHLETAEHMLGSFCSPACLAAVEALVALHHWAGDLDRRGRIDEAEAREALADELLVLWRRRAGPDPKLVAQAVEVARAGGRSDAGARLP
jgi:hypothetical protein